jgi:uncharacterized membrane protein
MESITTGFNNVLTQLAEWGPKVILGFLLLIVGWIIAKVAQKAVIGICKKLNVDKPFENATETDALKSNGRRPSSIAGLAAFWVIMTFVFIGFFSAMNLTMVAEPLTTVLNNVGAGIPNFLGAVILLLFGWLIATLLKGLSIKTLDKIHADQKLKEFGLMTEEMADKKKFSFLIGLFVYGLVILLFAQSALELIGLKLVASTMNSLVDSAVGIIPHIFSAAIVLAVAYLIALLARPFIKSVLESTSINKFGPHFGLAEKEEEGKLTLSEVGGNTVFWLILLFAFPAVLDQLNIDPVVEPLRGVWDKIFSTLPNVMAALLMLTVTYFLIKFLTPIVKGLLEGLGVDTLLGKIGLVKLQETVETNEKVSKPSEILVRVLTVIVGLMVTQEVLNILGMTYMAEMVQSIVNYIPNVLIAAVIVGFAFYLGNVVADLAEGASSGLDKATSKLFSSVARVAVFTFGITMALTQLNVGGQVVEGSVLLLVGGISLALAISVGLGAKPLVERYLEAKVATNKPESNS